MRKKLIALSVLLTLFLTTGCSVGTATGTETDQLDIVCTLFPEYDWTREIMGGQEANITYLLNNGTDLHNYQPSAKDMITISDCDLLIYIGGESESWLDDAVKESTNPDRKIIRLMDVLGDAVREEEIKEGMQAEPEHEEAEAEPEYDEHIWLSVRNAEILCRAICDALCEIQPEQTEIYQANLEAYTEKLSALDEDFSAMAEQASVKTVIFGDRFPFLYLVNDYAIDYYAAFAGCSSETEASFETVTFLADKLNALQIDTVFTIENADDSLAKTIIANTENKNQQIVRLDSMQSVTEKDIADGASYLSIMQENLHTLQEALS